EMWHGRAACDADGPRQFALSSLARQNRIARAIKIDRLKRPSRRDEPWGTAAMNCWRKIGFAMLLCLAIFLGDAGSAAAQAKPEGEMRFAVYVTIAPAWLDPGETGPGNLTPFWMMYALHDALVKPMPGNLMAPS